MGRLGRFTLITTTGAALLIGGAALLWPLIGGAPMSGHGWIALSIGALGVAALTALLMSLAFHSSRTGHDARVGQPDETAPPRRLD